MCKHSIWRHKSLLNVYATYKNTLTCLRDDQASNILTATARSSNDILAIIKCAFVVVRVTLFNSVKNNMFSATRQICTKNRAKYACTRNLLYLSFSNRNASISLLCKRSVISINELNRINFKLRELLEDVKRPIINCVGCICYTRTVKLYGKKHTHWLMI